MVDKEPLEKFPADAQSLLHLGNDNIVEFAWDENADLYYREMGDDDYWTRLFFDDEPETFIIPRVRNLFWSELPLVRGGKGIQVKWDVMESDQWSAYVIGGYRLCFHCADNKIICTHIYWPEGTYDYLKEAVEGYFLNQNILDWSFQEEFGR
jgi:hypothetical protein